MDTREIKIASLTNTDPAYAINRAADLPLAADKMKIIFSKSERDYIVENKSSDLSLTSIGFQLIEKCKEVDREFCVETNTLDYDEFIDNLRDEFIWKIRRISNPQPLNSMAKKFLDDYHSLQPMRFLANHQIEPTSLNSSELGLN